MKAPTLSEMWPAIEQADLLRKIGRRLARGGHRFALAAKLDDAMTIAETGARSDSEQRVALLLVDVLHFTGVEERIAAGLEDRARTA